MLFRSRDRCLPGPSPLFCDATWPFFRRGSRIRRSVGSLSRCGVMEIVFYAGLLLFVLFGPWILVWRMNRGRKQNREEDQSRLRELTNRVLALELGLKELRGRAAPPLRPNPVTKEDRKSTRLNSSHGYISYAVFCLKKKKQQSNLIILLLR